MKSLTGRISPMVYVMMFVSVIIGFFFATGFDMGLSESILYSTGVLIHRGWWGLALLITASIAEIGFFVKDRTLIGAGAIGGFSLWAFAAFSSLLAGHMFILLSPALFHLVFHGYVILASSLNVLERTATSKL